MTPLVSALLIKLTLILSLGLAVAATLRAFSPSFRHLVLYATLASGAALPLVMWMSPQWNVRVLPRSIAGANALPSSTAVRPSNTVSPAQVVNVGAAQSSSGTLTQSAAGQSASTLRDVFAVIPLLPLLWAIGFAAVIAWLTVGRFGLRRIAATAWPLNSADWQAILDEERNYAGVAKPVLLSSSSVVSTPLTWGTRAPVILLPEESLDWPEAHRRIVLRHELAHIARGDSLTQLVAGFICALYWFHPLVWITERRLRAECERACDDNVVSLGTPAAEYAAHLLEVARSARAFGAPGFLSVAMARPSQLEGRLLAVLNESRRRVSLSRRARPVAVLLSALILIPLGAFRPVERSDAQPRDDVAGVGPNAAAAPAASISSVAPAPIQSAALKSISPSVLTPISKSELTSTFSSPTTSSWSAVFGTAESAVEAPKVESSKADTTFLLSAPARTAGTLELDLKTGGNIIITGWDRPEISVRASLAGRDWRVTSVRLVPSGGGATLESDFTVRENSQSTSHTFRISVPRSYNVRIASSGGSVSITGVDGTFTGQTGGGEINIQKTNGEVYLRTGGGDVHVSDSRLNGSVRTGGGMVRIEGNTGDLTGKSGSGPVITTKGKSRQENGVTIVEADSVSGSGSSSVSVTTDGKSNEPYYVVDGVRVPGIGGGSGSASASGSGARARITSKSGGVTTSRSYSDDGSGNSSSFGANGIRMNSAGGAISLRAAPDGARVTTGGGAIRIGPSGGEVYALTGGGNIDLGPATGSVEAHTGAGEVTIELKGADDHSVDVTSGLGPVTLILPRDLNATLNLETAYTENLGHKTRIESDFPLQTTETPNWDAREGTPRRYVRARQTVGRGGPVIRVRTVNGDIVIKRS